MCDTHYRHKRLKDILMYVPYILYNLLFRPTYVQYINNKVSIVMNSYMFRSIYINVIRESFPRYAKVPISVQLTHIATF
jgi:hypothetical protein